jgi:hypothetical protein
MGSHQVGGAHIIAPAGTVASGWHFAGTGDLTRLLVGVTEIFPDVGTR